MWEFLQAYGSWVVLGVFFLLMLRMHGGGGCGARQMHSPSETADTPGGDAQTTATSTAKPPTGGCH